MTAFRFFERKGFVCVVMVAYFAVWANRSSAGDVVTQPIRTFVEHTSYIGSVAFSPDGTRVLTGSWDGTARLWDVATGFCIRTFSGHTDGVKSVAFSPDGTKVLTGSYDMTAKLWDVATGSLIRTFAESSSVNSVAFSPDGTKVLTGCGVSYGFGNLWDVTTGSLIRTFIGHTWEVSSVAFSRDGTHVLTGSEDRTAKLWSIATGSCIRTFVGHTNSILSVAFSPDGTRILTGSYDKTAKLWDIATGACIRTFVGHTSFIKSVAFSPDGTKVLTGSRDGTAKLWDAATGSCICTFVHTSLVYSVAFSPNGTSFVTASLLDGIARLWRTNASSPQPVINEVVPTIPVATGVSQSFTIYGSNFSQTATVTLCDVGSNIVYPNRAVSSRTETQITINPNFGTSAGKWSVEAINPGPVSSREFNFSVRQPDVVVERVNCDLTLRLPFLDRTGSESYLVTQAYASGVHEGIDFDLPSGTPVVAACKGKVCDADTFTGNDSNIPSCDSLTPRQKAGTFVKLKHQGLTSEWYSSYQHLSRRLVNVDDEVGTGDILGYSGNTGCSSGSHLHFEMRNSQNKGVRPVPMNGIVVSTGATTITDFVISERYRAISSGVQNGSFAEKLLDYWTTGGHVELFEDPTWPGVCWAKLIALSATTLSQTVSTPIDRFEVSFSYRFSRTTGSLSVVLDSVVLATIEAPAALSGDFSTFKVVVNDPSLQNLQNTVLEFQFSGLTGSEVLVSNVVLSPVLLYGDANNDCRVDILDLIFIRNRLGQDPATSDNWNADVNQDGKINILDLLAVRSKLGTRCSQ